VPWIKGVGQRGFNEEDLPKDVEKRHLYELGKQLFFDSGYVEIGMDHFALPTDSLYKAMKNKTLHRNFMGYTAGKTELMVGLGMSSISDSWSAFAQNVKSVKEYTSKVNEGVIPIFRGHLLSTMDLIIRKNILDLMCNLETKWNSEMDAKTKAAIINRLSEMIDDGFVELTEDGIIVKEQGRMFVRNICMAFDVKLIENKPETRIFSMTI
jgi:oxygen-independent coproporphyrinogen-3 oxidase